jgi:hypothetical protein
MEGIVPSSVYISDLNRQSWVRENCSGGIRDPRVEA